jgi:hypothetical protein
VVAVPVDEECGDVVRPEVGSKTRPPVLDAPMRDGNLVKSAIARLLAAAKAR